MVILTIDIFTQTVKRLEIWIIWGQSKRSLQLQKYIPLSQAVYYPCPSACDTNFGEKGRERERETECLRKREREKERGSSRYQFRRGQRERKKELA